MYGRNKENPTTRSSTDPYVFSYLPVGLTSLLPLNQLAIELAESVNIYESKIREQMNEGTNGRMG